MGKGKKLRILVIVPLAVFAMFVVFMGSGSGAPVWNIETLDSSGTVGLNTSLAFDPSDLPHISYYYSTSEDLRHTSWNGSSWTVENVDTGGNVGEDTSIDARGVISISYYDNTNADLKFAQRLDGVWTAQTVDTGGGTGTRDTGQYTSLEMDASGNAHISYYSNSGTGATKDLRYASYVSSGGNCGSGVHAGKWQCDSIDATSNVGKYSSLALDTSGMANISYYDESNTNPKYAHQVSGGGNCGPSSTWQCETIETSANTTGTYTSIAVGSDGYPQVSYKR